MNRKVYIMLSSASYISSDTKIYERLKPVMHNNYITNAIHASYMYLPTGVPRHRDLCVKNTLFDQENFQTLTDHNSVQAYLSVRMN